jgi:ribosome modulation factor
MNAFLKFRADRAFHDGMHAYHEGQSNHAPAKYCEHASDWVRGWNVAWLAEGFRQDKLLQARARVAPPATK